MEGLIIGAILITLIFSFPVLKYFRERFVWNKGKCALCKDPWARTPQEDIDGKYMAYKCKCSTAYFTYPTTWLGRQVREKTIDASTVTQQKH